MGFPCLEPGRAARRVDCAGETERDGGICGRCPGRAAQGDWRDWARESQEKDERLLNSVFRILLNLESCVVNSWFDAGGGWTYNEAAGETVRRCFEAHEGGDEAVLILVQSIKKWFARNITLVVTSRGYTGLGVGVCSRRRSGCLHCWRRCSYGDSCEGNDSQFELYDCWAGLWESTSRRNRRYRG